MKNKIEANVHLLFAIIASKELTLIRKCVSGVAFVWLVWALNPQKLSNFSRHKDLRRALGCVGLCRVASQGWRRVWPLLLWLSLPNNGLPILSLGLCWVYSLLMVVQSLHCSLHNNAFHFRNEVWFLFRLSFDTNLMFDLKMKASERLSDTEPLAERDSRCGQSVAICTHMSNTFADRIIDFKGLENWTKV